MLHFSENGQNYSAFRIILIIFRTEIGTDKR